MGKEIESLVPHYGHEITAKFNSTDPLHPNIQTGDIDVLIDFSIPDVVLGNVRSAVKISKPLVIGTTGWSHQLEEIQNALRNAEIGVIYASNFSLGMNLFFRIIENAAKLMDRFDEYDPYIHELHHRGKVDSPSGTALTLAEILQSRLERKNNVLPETAKGQILPAHLHVTSTRSGKIPGTHIVGFDSEADSIEIKHTARNRSGFALGALYAAEWIIGKQGLFTMADLMNSQLDFDS